MIAREHPEDDDRREVTEGGSEVYRYDEADEQPMDLAPGDPELIEAISDHIERHVGECTGVLHELISPGVHVDVHVTPLRDDPSVTALITSGMSEKPMSAPKEMSAFSYAELAILLPTDWPGLGGEVGAQKMDDNHPWHDETNYWPIRWMKQLARFPHEYDTWLGPGHTIRNGDPADPLADNTGLIGWLVTPNMIGEGEAFDQLELPDRVVHFYTLLPLYQQEMDYKVKRGFDALAQRLGRYDISPVIDPNRVNVCRKRWGIF